MDRFCGHGLRLADTETEAQLGEREAEIPHFPPCAGFYERDGATVHCKDWCECLVRKKIAPVSIGQSMRLPTRLFSKIGWRLHVNHKRLAFPCCLLVVSRRVAMDAVVLQKTICLVIILRYTHTNMIFQGICMHSIDVLVPKAVIAGAIPRDITGWRVR